MPRFAVKLTKAPSTMRDSGAEDLRSIGFSDRDILDLVEDVATTRTPTGLPRVAASRASLGRATDPPAPDATEDMPGHQLKGCCLIGVGLRRCCRIRWSGLGRLSGSGHLG